MFFQLLEIQTLSKNSRSLEEAKGRLNSVLLQAFQAQPKVKQSLNQTIEKILGEAISRYEILSKIQEDSLSGYLVPSYLDFQALIRGRGELPEWSRSVLQKQFEKQKQQFELIVRKIYSSHGLTQSKGKFAQQINSFRVLADRYKVLSKHQESIDIMKEAQNLHSTTFLTTQKFLTFLNLVGSKVTSFVEEVATKCQHLGLQLNSIGSRNNQTTGYQIQSTGYHQRFQSAGKRYDEQFKRTQQLEKTATGASWLSKANRTLGKAGQHCLMRQPRWIATYSSNYFL